MQDRANSLGTDLSWTPFRRPPGPHFTAVKKCLIPQTGVLFLRENKSEPKKGALAKKKGNHPYGSSPEPSELSYSTEVWRVPSSRSASLVVFDPENQGSTPQTTNPNHQVWGYLEWYRARNPRYPRDWENHANPTPVNSPLYPQSTLVNLPRPFVVFLFSPAPPASQTRFRKTCPADSGSSDLSVAHIRNRLPYLPPKKRRMEPHLGPKM